MITEGMVKFYDYTVQVSIVQGELRKALKQKQFVRCFKKVTIQPKTEKIVWTKAGNGYQAEGTVLITHSVNSDDYGLHAAMV